MATLGRQRSQRAAALPASSLGAHETDDNDLLFHKPLSFKIIYHQP
jgi:hypothetical protein